VTKEPYLLSNEASPVETCDVFCVTSYVKRYLSPKKKFKNPKRIAQSNKMYFVLRNKFRLTYISVKRNVFRLSLFQCSTSLFVCLLSNVIRLLLFEQRRITFEKRQTKCISYYEIHFV